METQTIEGLIAELEKLSGPDRETDLRISVAINYRTAFGKDIPWRWSVMADEIETVNRPRGVLDPVQFVPRWTASVDAALMLFGEDWFYHVSRFSPGHKPQCNAHIYAPPDLTLPIEFGEDAHWDADAATVPLALCIAALKARAAMTAEQTSATGSPSAEGRMSSTSPEKDPS